MKNVVRVNNFSELNIFIPFGVDGVDGAESPYSF